MSDNTIIPPAAGGDTIRDIDRGTGSKTQVVQLDVGGAAANPEKLVTDGAPLPVKIDPSGQPAQVVFSPDALGPAGMDGALPVTLALDQPPVLVQVNPTGQQPMMLSLSLTMASDQTSIPVIANQGVSPYNVAGSVAVTNLPATQPVSGAVSVSNFPASQAVTGTFFQPTQPVSLASAPLPANAAQEVGGNLASLVTLATQLQQLIELNKMILAAAKANNLLLASIGGTSVNPSDMLDDVTFQ